MKLCHECRKEIPGAAKVLKLANFQRSFCSSDCLLDCYERVTKRSQRLASTPRPKAE